MNMFDKAVLALPGARVALAVVSVAALARAVLTLGEAFFLATAIVNLWEGAAIASQAGAMAAFFACFVGVQVVSAAQDAWLSRYAADCADELRQSLLRTVFSRGPAVVADQGTGNVSTAVIDGIDDVEAYIKLILPKMASLFIVPIVLVAVVFAFDWVSGLIMLVAFPVIVYFMILIGYNAQEAASSRYREFTRLSNHFVDSLRGLDTLAVFGRSRQQSDVIFDVSERFREATMKTLRIATLSSAVLDMAATLSLAAVAIMLGFRMTAGALAFFPALFVLIVTPEYFKPIREFASDYHASLDGRTALASINELIAQGEGADGAGAQKHDAGEAGARGSVGGGSANEASTRGVACAADSEDAPCELEPWGPTSTLELRDVDFSYREHLALREVSLSVSGAAKIGIVGASGSGKSTLIGLLAGFLEPSTGSVSVQGRNLESLHTPAWQNQVLYIPQSPYIFHATLRDNIAFYTPDASDAAIARAVALVGLEDVVAELPQGLDTRIGEGARVLSGGERQRVALARALLDDTRRVLLFDEPTAHLDIETEMELKERMLPVMEGRLVLFATHRLHWVADMDAVAVMEAGQLVQFGTPEELLREEGAFRRLVERMEGGAR